MPKSTLSDNARAVLQSTCNHPEQLAFPPAHLPAAAQWAVVRSLLKTSLLEEVLAEGDQPSWRVTDAGLLAIGTGFAAPGVDAPGQTVAVLLAATQPIRRETVRRSADGVVAAWDDKLANTHPALASAVASLRNALMSQRLTGAVSGGPRQPLRNTKRALVLGLPETRGSPSQCGMFNTDQRSSVGVEHPRFQPASSSCSIVVVVFGSMGVGVGAAGASAQQYLITVGSSGFPSRPEISTSCFSRQPARAFSRKIRLSIGIQKGL